VVFEMLTGRQAFGATDPTTIMARVVDREPDFSMLPANLHPRLTDLLRRCLRKDAKQRYQDIGDVRMDLDAILADPSGLIIEPAARVDATPRSTVRWAVAVLIAAVVAGAAGWVLKPAPPRPVRRENYFLPPGTNFRNTSTTVIAVAPDGQSYVYNATGGLYLRKVRDLHAQLIVESNDVTNPFFSPDGRWVGYWNRSSKAIEKVAVSGGSAIRIAPVVIEPTGISWGADDTILFTMQNAIFRVSSDSGRPERIFESASGKTLSGATLLPEGKGVLFTQAEGGDWNAGEIFVVSLNYTSTGHLVYAVRDQLLAIGFDLRALKPEGTPVQVAQGVDRAGTSDSANYGVSDDGSLVYVTGGPGGGKLGDPLSLVWVDREQKETIVGVSAAEYVSPRLNPKGTQVAAFVGRSLNSDVWVADLTRQPPPLTKVTINPSLDAFPVWIADSGDVVFSSIRGNQKKGLRSFFRQRADGSAEAEHLIDVETPGHWQAHSFSPDHRTLAFGYAGTKTGADIGLITMEGTPSWKPLLETTAAEWHPAISPKTGNWIAYSSNRGGTEEIYVERFPGLGDRVPVSAGGGSMPVWSADETELFYIRPDGAIMVVPIQPGSKLLPLTPRMLIPPGPYITKRPNVVNYDYDSRRQRFLLVRPAGNDDPKSRPSIVTVLNWATELAEQVPAR
jgi:Tol biopolymer transport system component